jgi:hypothetical protein
MVPATVFQIVAAGACKVLKVEARRREKTENPSLRQYGARADHHAARRRLLLGPGRGLTNMLSPPQEMLRPFIGNLKSRRVLIDVGYASYPAFFESHGEVVNVEAQRGHRRSHDEIHACVAVEPLPDLVGFTCSLQC